MLFAHGKIHSQSLVTATAEISHLPEFEAVVTEFRKSNPDVGDKVIVFNITDEVPNDVVAASSLLPDSLQTAIYEAIHAYLETEEGEAVFDEMYGWTSIRRAVDSDFDVVRAAAEALGITEPLG